MKAAFFRYPFLLISFFLPISGSDASDEIGEEILKEVQKQWSRGRVVWEPPDQFRLYVDQPDGKRRAEILAMKYRPNQSLLISVTNLNLIPAVKEVLVERNIYFHESFSESDAGTWRNFYLYPDISQEDGSILNTLARPTNGVLEILPGEYAITTRISDVTTVSTRRSEIMDPLGQSEPMAFWDKENGYLIVGRTKDLHSRAELYQTAMKILAQLGTQKIQVFWGTMEIDEETFDWDYPHLSSKIKYPPPFHILKDFHMSTFANGLTADEIIYVPSSFSFDTVAGKLRAFKETDDPTLHDRQLRFRVSGQNGMLIYFPTYLDSNLPLNIQCSKIIGRLKK